MAPERTISAISMVALSVTRRPLMNWVLTPAFSIMASDLRAAAVHHHRMHAQKLQKHGVGGELLRHRLLAHGVTAVFDHHRLAVIGGAERQRLRQRLRRGPTGFEIALVDILGHGGAVPQGRPCARKRGQITAMGPIVTIRRPPPRFPPAAPVSRPPSQKRSPPRGGRRPGVWRWLSGWRLAEPPRRRSCAACRPW